MIYNEKLLNTIKSESYVSPKIEKRVTGKKGAGLFAKEKIYKNEIVSISGGIIILSEVWEDFREEYGDYAYFIHNNFLIAPLNPQDPSDDWRMNHCCHPNCGVKGQIIFVAMQDIEINDELTFDYAMTETDPRYDIDLKCDKSNCRNKFTGNDWRLPELQKKYKSYFSLYIQEKIDNP
jgi:SET domain-containing protein